MPKVEPTVRVIKKTSCPTLSGSSELIYCLGSDPEDQLMIKIYSNTGGGFFSDEWLQITSILETLEDWGDDKPITSVALTSLFRGRSVNTPAFLMAALRAEGVLEPIEGKQRCHQLGDVKAFLSAANELQSKKTHARKAAARKKAPVKRKAPARSKK